jgi:hypothetical protein
MVVEEAKKQKGDILDNTVGINVKIVSERSSANDKKAKEQTTERNREQNIWKDRTKKLMKAQKYP